MKIKRIAVIGLLALVSQSGFTLGANQNKSDLLERLSEIYGKVEKTEGSIRYNKLNNILNNFNDILDGNSSGKSLICKKNNSYGSVSYTPYDIFNNIEIGSSYSSQDNCNSAVKSSVRGLICIKKNSYGSESYAPYDINNKIEIGSSYSIQDNCNTAVKSSVRGLICKKKNSYGSVSYTPYNLSNQEDVGSSYADLISCSSAI